MGWRAAEFKGKTVWVEVDAQGVPRASGGRVPIRYSKAASAKVYRAGVSRVMVKEDGPIVDLSGGVPADSPGPKKRGRASGFGKAGTRTAHQTKLAAAAAQELLAGLATETVVCYTDGACRGNPGPAGSGVVITFPDGRVAEASKSLGRATNNVAELTAISLALELLDGAGLPKDASVALLSDSDYCNGMLTAGWKAKKNVALIEGLRARWKQRSGMRMYWVAGHAGIAGNERADALANRGVEGHTDTVWRNE